MKLKHIKIFKNQLFFLFLLTSIATGLLYRNIFDNPFIHDDFVWLDYGRRLASGDCSGIFPFTGSYYPVVIHILFSISFVLFDLNYSWYHAISLFIHIVNGILLYWLIYLLFKDCLWALLTAFLFLVNPVISNAIIWPSAWVDLFAASGFLLSLISYKLFLNKGLKWLYVIALLSYLFSIFSKVIGIGLPFMLLFLEIIATSFFDKESYKQILKRQLPFFLVAICYSIPIALGLEGSGKPQTIIYNIFRYIPALFVPEGYLTLKATIILTIAFFVLIISLYLRHKKEVSLLLLVLVLTLTPLAILGFTLKPVMFLDSISHRLYIPSIGVQMLIGLMVSNIYRSLIGKTYKKLSFTLTTILCASFLAWSFVEIDQREKAWDFESKNTFNLFQQLKAKEEKLSSNSLIYLINIPSSGAFWEPMVRLYYNNPSVNVIRYPHMPDFSRYAKVSIYLYIKGWLLNDHKSIMKIANSIGIDDIWPVMKFYELKGWNNEKLELLNAISASAFNDAKMHYRLAQAYQDMKMLDDAESEYMAALLITPYDLELHYNLGLLYIAKKQHDKAVEEFKFVAEHKDSPLSPMAERFIKYLSKARAM